MRSPEYLAFLDKRIPELHAMGKPPIPEGLTSAQRAALIPSQLAASKYPGRKAREKADVEWAEHLRKETPNG